MMQPTNNRMSSLDAGFLYLESKQTPMHVGSVCLFQGPLPFEAFVNSIQSKLHLVPRYTQIVIPAPFNLGHPSWECDPNFDIRHHMFEAEAEAPGDDKEIGDLAGRILTGIMDRKKPLWEMYIVNGLKNNRSALITRVHHCMIDGVSGMELMKLILDITPNPEPPPPPSEPPTPPAPPLDVTQKLFDAFMGSVQESINSWQNFQSSLASFWTNTGNQLLPPGRAVQSMSLPASPLPFNRPCSGERKLVWMECSFAESRAIRAKCGGTVNDVVLTVLSGAVKRYTEAHRKSVKGLKFRPMVPVSMRRDDQRGAMGNLVSVLPLEIPLDIDDPVARLQHIAESTKTMKEGRMAERLNIMSTLLGTVPAQTQAFFGALASLPNSAITPFHMVCTNIPGPQIPLYAMGRRMLGTYPYVPLGSTLAISCGVQSYDQKLCFGFSADTGAVQDVEVLRDAMTASFLDLRNAAGVDAIPRPDEKPSQPEHGSDGAGVEESVKESRKPFPGRAVETRETVGA